MDMTEKRNDGSVSGWRPEQSAYEGRTDNPRSDTQDGSSGPAVGSGAHQTSNAASSESVTDEVGDEGGGTGDVELRRTSLTTGSEATSTVVPSEDQIDERHHDETGEGRRSP
jgi:hypothetical protein